MSEMSLSSHDSAACLSRSGATGCFFSRPAICRRRPAGCLPDLLPWVQDDAKSRRRVARWHAAPVLHSYPAHGSSQFPVARGWRGVWGGRRISLWTLSWGMAVKEKVDVDVGVKCRRRGRLKIAQDPQPQPRSESRLFTGGAGLSRAAGANPERPGWARTAVGGFGRFGSGGSALSQQDDPTWAPVAPAQLLLPACFLPAWCLLPAWNGELRSWAARQPGRQARQPRESSCWPFESSKRRPSKARDWRLEAEAETLGFDMAGRQSRLLHAPTVPSPPRPRRCSTTHPYATCTTCTTHNAHHLGTNA